MYVGEETIPNYDFDIRKHSSVIEIELKKGFLLGKRNVSRFTPNLPRRKAKQEGGGGGRW